MYGDLKVILNYVQSGEKKIFYFPSFSHTDKPQMREFKKRFIQFTYSDPDIYEFKSSSKHRTLNENTKFQFIGSADKISIDVSPKSETKIVTFKKLKTEDIKFLFKENANEKNMVKVLSKFSCCRINDITLKNIGENCFEVTAPISTKNVYLPEDEKIEIIYSKLTTVLDLKYEICRYNRKASVHCLYKGFELGDKQIFSKIDNITKAKIEFQRIDTSFHYKYGKSAGELKTSRTLNEKVVRRLLFKNLNISFECSAYLSVFNDNKQIDIKTGQDLSEICSNENPIIFSEKTKYSFINKKNKSEKCSLYLQPNMQFMQVRQKLASNIKHSSFFIDITKKQSNAPISLAQRISDFEGEKTFYFNLIETDDVDFDFEYNGKTIQLKINHKNTVKKVISKLKKQFKIRSKEVFLWINNIQVTNSGKFLDIFEREHLITVLVSGALTLNLTYKEKVTTFVLPLDMKMDALEKMCIETMPLANNDTNKVTKLIFFDKENDEKIENIIDDVNLPKNEYLAQFRRSSERVVNLKMVDCRSKSSKPNSANPRLASKISLQSSKPNPSKSSATIEPILDKVNANANANAYENSNSNTNANKDVQRGTEYDFKIQIFTSEGIIEKIGKFNVSDEKIIEFLKDKIDKYAQLLSVVLVNDNLCNIEYQISDFLNNSIPTQLVQVYPSGTYLFDLGKGDRKHLILSSDLFDARKQLAEKIGKPQRIISIKYGDTKLNDLSQRICLFKQGTRFKVEFLKEIIFTFLFEGIEEEVAAPGEKGTVADLYKLAFDFVKEKKGNSVKPANIRLSLNHDTLSKESNIILDFDDIVKIDLLEPFGFSNISTNMLFIHLSKDDKAKYALECYLEKMKVAPARFPEFMLTYDGIAVDNKNKIGNYPQDDGVCFIVTNYSQMVTLNLNIPNKDSPEVIKIVQETLYYSVKEFLAREYSIENCETIDLIDVESNEALDDNDSPQIETCINVVFNEEPKEINENEENKTLEPNMFICRFEFEGSCFEMKLDDNITCKSAKLKIAERYDEKNYNQEEIDPDDFSIYINNEEVSDNKVLKFILNDLQSKNITNHIFSVEKFDSNASSFFTDILAATHGT